ncbi:MAG: 30S ribosome-binding factor RbfA [Thermodesulfobacteriota bacterium]
MRPFSRADRVSGLIQKVLSGLLQKDIGDPRLQMVTITRVKISPDLKFARVYFCTGSGEKGKEPALQGFQTAMGFIKRALAPQLGLRYMPELKFFYDESYDHASRIYQILDSIKQHDGTTHSKLEEK